jgi:hypothetical protein
MARTSTLWQPPPRPDWVSRVNAEGACMNLPGVVPLDEDSLLASAIQATGLADFGRDDWREPFRVLLRALDAEAELNLIGRLRMRQELLLLLEARLRIEDTYKRHPEIGDEEIVQPIMILGQPRTGTSFLQNVLTANPDNGGLLQWEAMFPCPPPEKATYRTDPRIARADMLAKQWNRVTPTMVSVHEFAADVPIEDCEIFGITFVSPAWFSCFAQVPSYNAYVAGLDPRPTLEYYKRILKLLQWKNPREHWVMKDIAHLDRMEPLLEVFPDACLVWPHRDPVKALSSGISAIGTLQWTGTDHPFNNGSVAWVVDPEISARRFGMAIDRLDSGVVPPGRIHHILYKDLVGDTMGTLEKMYRHFGLRLSEEGRRGMAQYLADNPRDARPPHKLTVSSAAVAHARQVYQAYQAYFSVPSET